MVVAPLNGGQLSLKRQNADQRLKPSTTRIRPSDASVTNTHENHNRKLDLTNWWTKQLDSACRDKSTLLQTQTTRSRNGFADLKLMIDGFSEFFSFLIIAFGSDETPVSYIQDFLFNLPSNHSKKLNFWLNCSLLLFI